MSDNFIMFYNFILFYNFIRRRWINSFLTFDKFSIFDNLFFYEPFKASPSQLPLLSPLSSPSQPSSALFSISTLSAFRSQHSILSPQTIVYEKRAPTITVDTLPLVPAGTNVILLN